MCSFQTSGRTRGSISTQSISLQRHRTESVTVANRIRSDSNRTQSVHQEPAGEAEFLNHAVEPRARTAQLPPVMVSWASHVRNARLWIKADPPVEKNRPASAMFSCI